MAHGTRAGSLGHTIRIFSPDDTEDTLYIPSGICASSIGEKIQAKWPGIKLDEFYFSAEHIQTDCLGYDHYDFMDYTDYIRITARPSYFQRMAMRNFSA
jgi:hypothetical protein